MAAAQRQKVVMARRRFWARHLQGWKRSGLSQAEYCRQHQLSATTFAWWKTRGTPPTPAPPRGTPLGEDGSFVELAVAGRDVGETTAAVVYEIVLPQRRCLRLGSQFDRERVRQLLDLLERSC
jgi:hypothetical protein